MLISNGQVLLGAIMSKKADDIQFAIKLNKRMGLKGVSWENHVVAQYTLNEELGNHGTPEAYYDLDQTTRDVLLAHARQDAEHALLNTTSILKNQKKLYRLVFFLTIVMCIVLFIVLQGGPRNY